MLNESPESMTTVLLILVIGLVAVLFIVIFGFILFRRWGAREDAKRERFRDLHPGP